MKTKRELLSSGQVARKIGVCRETVVRWWKAGVVEAEAVVNGHPLFDQEVLEKLQDRVKVEAA